MKTIPLSSIQIPPDRQRKEFLEADLQELVESIRAYGLFHPVVLREILSVGDKTTIRHELVSGERRIRAATDIYALGGRFRHDAQDVPCNEIPWVCLEDLPELEREEAEFDENHKRVNLTWQEEAAAVQRLAAARAKAGKTEQLDPVIVREVARTAIPAASTAPTGSLGVHQETTRRQIIVAQHMHVPEVAKAKDVNEAFKVLKRQEETARRVVLAGEVGKTYTADVHTLLNEDSLAWMKAAEAEHWDVICTDPIYGIGADEFGDSGGRAAGAHFYKDDYETWKVHVSALARDGFRITKKQAHLYAFCDITRFEEFKAILSDEGWNCFRTPFIWHKPNGSRTPWVDFGPQRQYELILYANKGRKPVTRIYPDVLTYRADENLGHHAQKPVALIEDLLKRSVGPGDRVLDPFCGSGPILVAAHSLQCRATALEVDAAAYGIAVERLQKLSQSPELAGL